LVPRINDFDFMSDADRLIRLLQSADAAAAVPPQKDELANRVRWRRAATVERIHRIKLGALAGVAVVLVAVALRSWQPPAPPGGGVPMDRRLAQNPSHPEGTRPGASGPVGDVAKLRAEADALGAEADALERQMALIHGEQVRRELRDEHQSQLAAQIERHSFPDSIDRAALVGLSQGDFYRDVRQSTDDARAAYESVVDHFPNSQWAALAQGRIDQLQMN
jgi:hypothetical protein